MKNFKGVLVVALLVSTLPIAASARAKNTATVNLPESAQLAGMQLAPGHYALRWLGSGPTVKVTFFRDDKQVATAPAQLLTNSVYSNAVELDTAGNQKVIRQVDINKHLALLFLSANK